MSGMWTDLRYVLRVLARSRGFTAVAVSSLALGIGANTAMFGVVRTLLFTPLPVEAPQELSIVTWRREGKVSIGQTGSTSYVDAESGLRYNSSFSHPIYVAMRESAPAGAQLFAFAFLRAVSVAVGDQPALVAGGLLADGRYFSTLGVGMALGRPLTEADDLPGAPLVAVLSHSFWMRAFGGDPDALGRTVRVNGQSAEIVGVSAEDFQGLSSSGGFFPRTEVTLPLSAQPVVYPRMGSSLFTSERTFWLRLMARVRPDAGTGAAERAFTQAMRAQPSPLVGGDEHLPEVRLLPGAQGVQPVRGETARLLWLLLGVVGVVLVIACVNLAGLMLSRGIARQRELAVRRALGGGRARLVRQMLLEALVLAAAGTSAGLALTLASGGLVERLLSGSLGAGMFAQVGLRGRLDPVVLGVSAGLGIGATLVFGLLPALRASGVDPMSWLKHRSTGSGAPRLMAGRVLIAAQIAVSVPLLVGAALFLRTVANLASVDLGFEPAGIVAFRLDPGFTPLPEEEYARLYQDVLTRVQEIPGVRSATLIENALMSDVISNGRVTVDGREHMLFRNAVGPAFLETMGMRLVAGRVPGLQDTPDQPWVGAVNEAAVRDLFGGASPIGRILHIGGRDVQIVGVVNDVPYKNRRDPVPPTLYDAALQRNGWGGHHVLLRADASVARLEPAVREAVSGVHPDLPVPELRSQLDFIAESTGRERVFMHLLVIFGLFALLLASIGLHGVTAYAVSRRTSEIGVRVAVGARPGQILWMVLAQVVALAGAGLVLGVPAALATAPLVGSLLFGVEPSSPWTVAGAAALMLAVAVGAGLVPALRAARMDALNALRSE